MLSFSFPRKEREALKGSLVETLSIKIKGMEMKAVTLLTFLNTTPPDPPQLLGIVKGIKNSFEWNSCGPVAKTAFSLPSPWV